MSLHTYNFSISGPVKRINAVEDHQKKRSKPARWEWRNNTALPKTPTHSTAILFAQWTLSIHLHVCHPVEIRGRWSRLGGQFRYAVTYVMEEG